MHNGSRFSCGLKQLLDLVPQNWSKCWQDGFPNCEECIPHPQNVCVWWGGGMGCWPVTPQGLTAKFTSADVGPLVASMANHFPNLHVQILSHLQLLMDGK